MKRTPFAFALALALGLSTLPSATPALAAPTGAAAEADGHYKRGVELYKEADYRAALIEFRRAYDLMPAYQALYNIAETHYQLQDYAGALKAFEHYLADGGGQLSAERRDAVEKDIAKLRLRVAKVELVTSVPDVEVTVDDVAVGKTPFSQPVMVSAGRRKIVATKSGRPPFTKVIDVAGGDSIKLPIDISADAASPPDVPPKGGPAPESPRGSVPALPWIATGVLAGGAVVTGVLALGASNDLTKELDARPGNADSVSSAHSKAFSLGLATDVLAGAAIVAAGVSIYFTVSALSSDKAEKPAGALRLRRPGERAPVTVRVTAGPRSVALTGSF